MPALPWLEILSYNGKKSAECMTEFGSGRKRHYVLATVDSHLRVKFYVDKRYRRHWHSCARHGVRGRVAANNFNCSGSGLMAYDLEYMVRHHVRRHVVVVDGDNDVNSPPARADVILGARTRQPPAQRTISLGRIDSGPGIWSWG